MEKIQMSKKPLTKDPGRAKTRNMIAVSSFLNRPGAGPMKDRRVPRGGSSNKLRDFLDDLDDENEIEDELSIWEKNEKELENK